jgi:hypothetical protein
MATPESTEDLIELNQKIQSQNERLTRMDIYHKIQIEKLQNQLNAQEQCMREMESRMTERLLSSESKYESLGYAELELCKGAMCIDENPRIQPQTHFPLNAKQLHLFGIGGIKSDFTLSKLTGFYNLNHLCLSSFIAVDSYRVELWHVEHKIPLITDDAIFSNTVKILELRDSSAFEDLKIISRFPRLTKLIVRRCLLSDHIHLILPSIKHSITEIDFINVRCNRNINYAELNKYCNENQITLRVN